MLSSSYTCMSNFKNAIRKLIYLSASTCCVACSSIETAYYARPEKQYELRGPEFCDVACGHANLAHVDLYYHASTVSSPAYQVTYRGPCLVPFWPVDERLLDTKDLQLALRVIPKSAANSTGIKQVRVKKAGFALETNVRMESPIALSIYDVSDGQYSIKGSFSFAEYMEPMREAYDLPSDSEIKLWYMNVRYSEIEWFAVQAHLELIDDAGTVTPVVGPRVVFTPDQDHKYTPFEIPFMYAPVR